MSKNIVVVSKRPSPAVLPYGVDGLQRLILVPGENDVDEDAWNDAKDREPNKQFISGPTSFLSVKKGAKAAQPLADNLGLVTPAEKAIEYVNKCTSMTVLKTWGRNETRVTVQRALAARIKELSAPPEGQTTTEA